MSVMLITTSLRLRKIMQNLETGCGLGGCMSGQSHAGALFHRQGLFLRRMGLCLNLPFRAQTPESYTLTCRFLSGRQDNLQSYGFITL